jgi:exopolysaccharide production protein ExoZ
MSDLPKTELTQMSLRSKQFKTLQALRGIAALMVVLHHTDMLFGTHHLFFAGYCGVDIFFVLSGFIMTQVHSQDFGNPRRVGEFYLKRILRIFPLYWVILFSLTFVRFVLPLLWGGHASPVIGLLKEAPTTGVLLNLPWNKMAEEPSFSLLEFLQHMILVPYSTVIVPLVWTLSHELWFYFLFSIGILAPRRVFLTLVFLVLAATGVLQVLALAGVVPIADRSMIGFLLSPLNFEFAAGCVIAHLVRMRRIKHENVLFKIGCVLFLLALPFGVLLAENPPQVEMMNRLREVTIFLVPVFLIMLGLVAKESRENIRVPKTLVYLGDASYSIYLIHMPLMLFAVKLMTLLRLEKVLTTDYLALVMAGLLGGAGCLCYAFLERPMLQFCRRHFFRHG